MDKHLAGLLGAMTALGVAAPAHAVMPAPLTIESAMAVNSYADLLRPIPNAVALLRESAAKPDGAQAADGEGLIQEVQFYHHHHHHHHHRYYRRRYYHHHHHHHHRYIRPYGF